MIVGAHRRRGRQAVGVHAGRAPRPGPGRRVDHVLRRPQRPAGVDTATWPDSAVQTYVVHMVRMRREVEREFWLEIAEGASSEEAAGAVGVSQAADARRFRQAGGMPPFQLTGLSGRRGICFLNPLAAQIRRHQALRYR